MRSPLGVIIFISVMLLLDIYVFQAIKAVSQWNSPRARLILYIIYWTITVLAVGGFLLFVFTDQHFLPKKVRTYLFAMILGLFFAKMIAMVFFLIDDVRRILQWAAGKLFYNNTEGESISGEKISRSMFLSWLGLAAGGGLYGSLIYGFTNKYKYDIKNIRLNFNNLPGGFKGLRILHISDIHCGSFTDKKAVLHGVDMIMKQKADIILFTGDLINNMATEMADYMDIFGRLKAPMGVYSCFGNHDYGDYVNWPIDGVTMQHIPLMAIQLQHIRILPQTMLMEFHHLLFITVLSWLM